MKIKNSIFLAFLIAIGLFNALNPIALYSQNPTTPKTNNVPPNLDGTNWAWTLPLYYGMGSVQCFFNFKPQQTAVFKCIAVQDAKLERRLYTESEFDYVSLTVGKTEATLKYTQNGNSFYIDSSDAEMKFTLNSNGTLSGETIYKNPNRKPNKEYWEMVEVVNKNSNKKSTFQKGPKLSNSSLYKIGGNQYKIYVYNPPFVPVTGTTDYSASIKNDVPFWDKFNTHVCDNIWYHETLAGNGGIFIGWINETSKPGNGVFNTYLKLESNGEWSFINRNMEDYQKMKRGQDYMISFPSEPIILYLKAPILENGWNNKDIQYKFACK